MKKHLITGITIMTLTAAITACGSTKKAQPQETAPKEKYFKTY